MMILPDGIARDFGSGDNINRDDGIQRNYYNRVTIIDVEERSGSNLTDYQLAIAADVNPKDRIISREGMVRSFWRESATKTWVKDNIKAHQRTELLHFKGNSIALSASDGEATFDFFDDFETDLSKWTFIGGTWSIDAGTMFQSDTTVHTLGYTNMPALENYIAETKVKPVAGEFTSYIVGRYSTNNWYEYWLRLDFSEAGLTRNVDGIFTHLDKRPADITTVRWHEMKLVLNGTSIRTYLDGVLKADIIDASLTSGTVGVRTHFGAGRWDDYRVRKFADPEPSVVVGGEIGLLT